jgi:hypothetical protein
MDENKIDVGIVGISTVSLFSSLLLAEKGVSHNFYLEKNQASFLLFPPLSNPITCRKSQILEQKYLSRKTLNALYFIESYHFKWFNDNFEQSFELTGNFQFPVYAIDNRIRLHDFWSLLINNDLVTIKEEENIDCIDSNEKIKIIGGGEGNSNCFPDNFDFTREKFNIKREIIYFNLKSNKELLGKYKHVKMMSINNVADITLYPFLDINYSLSLSLVISITKEGKWDVFDSLITVEDAWKKSTELIRLFDKKLAEELYISCSLEKTSSFRTSVDPYFKIPVFNKYESFFAGVGEVIAKNDPITAQGYNSGISIAKELIETIILVRNNQDVSLLKSTYFEYANQQIGNLFHLNRAFTQHAYRFHHVYESAAKNPLLRDFIMTCYEDFSLYFPWLINENEGDKLIQNYNSKTL